MSSTHLALFSLSINKQINAGQQGHRTATVKRSSAMPPLNPPHLHFHKLKKRVRDAAGGGGGHHPGGMAKKGLASILYKLRDVHRAAPSPPASPSPSPDCHRKLCYPPPPSAWPWPSCRHPRTSSFRWPPQEEDAVVYRNVNTVYDTSSEHFNQRRSSLDEAPCIDRSFLAVPGEAAVEQPEDDGDQEKELQLRETAVVRGVRSERLFFEPAGAEFLSKQGLAGGKNEETAMDVTRKNDDEATTPPAGKDEEVATAADAAVMKGAAVVLTVESDDPYGDFRASMAEMVAAHGLREWEGLEELLAWYLKLNAKDVHGVIVGAFVDLLVSLVPSPSPSLPSPSPSSSCITFEDYSSATMEESCS